LLITVFSERKSYLETLEGALAGCDVLARVGHSDNRDVIVVTSQELLSTRDDVSNHDGGAQGRDHVFVVGVQNEPFGYLACKNVRKLVN